jgi:hypothetical protein
MYIRIAHILLCTSASSCVIIDTDQEEGIRTKYDVIIAYDSDGDLMLKKKTVEFDHEPTNDEITPIVASMIVGDKTYAYPQVMVIKHRKTLMRFQASFDGEDV